MEGFPAANGFSHSVPSSPFLPISWSYDDNQYTSTEPSWNMQPGNPHLVGWTSEQFPDLPLDAVTPSGNLSEAVVSRLSTNNLGNNFDVRPGFIPESCGDYVPTTPFPPTSSDTQHYDLPTSWLEYLADPFD